jgi:hypothetical protein
MDKAPLGGAGPAYRATLSRHTVGQVRSCLQQGITRRHPFVVAAYG